jgi:hypothetical protein
MSLEMTHFLEIEDVNLAPDASCMVAGSCASEVALITKHRTPRVGVRGLIIVV